MRLIIRKLAPGDSDRYRKIRLESLKKHPESYGASYEEESSRAVLRFVKVIEQPFDGSFVIGAFDEGDLIGICGFVPFSIEDVLDLPNAGTIVQMYVRSSYSGQKIGMNLTKAVVEEAIKNSNVDQIVLGVRKNNVPAIRVYEQAGFQTYAWNDDHQAVINDEFLVMILRL